MTEANDLTGGVVADEPGGPGEPTDGAARGRGPEAAPPGARPGAGRRRAAKGREGLEPPCGTASSPPRCSPSPPSTS
ncbi:hypothetical protein ACFQ10_17360 [Streptomyces indonesiensis]